MVLRVSNVRLSCSGLYQGSLFGSASSAVLFLLYVGYRAPLCCLALILDCLSTAYQQSSHDALSMVFRRLRRIWIHVPRIAICAPYRVVIATRRPYSVLAIYSVAIGFARPIARFPSSFGLLSVVVNHGGSSISPLTIRIPLAVGTLMLASFRLLAFSLFGSSILQYSGHSGSPAIVVDFHRRSHIPSAWSVSVKSTVQCTTIVRPFLRYSLNTTGVLAVTPPFGCTPQSA